MTAKSTPPSIVPGRKGGMSVADAMVKALWRRDSSRAWPQLTFDELRVQVSAMLGYAVGSSTVRSTVYGHPNVFTRTKSDTSKPIRYELTARVRA